MPRSRKERFAQAEEMAKRHGLPPGSYMEPVPYKPPQRKYPISSGTVDLSKETEEEKRKREAALRLGKGAKVGIK